MTDQQSPEPEHRVFEGVPYCRAVPLVFLDTETTGLRPDVHVPWEVGWITAVHYVAAAGTGEGGVIEVHERRAYQVRLAAHERLRADPNALRVGHFAERYLVERSADEPNDVMRQLTADVMHARTMARSAQGPMEDLRDGGDEPLPACYLVGAVPSFDHNMLTRWLGWPDFGEGLWHYHLIDVETLAAGMTRMPPPINTRILNLMLGIAEDDDAKHTALGDSVWAMNVYAEVYHAKITDAAPF